jgi:hypothetical protein
MFDDKATNRPPLSQTDATFQFHVSWITAEFIEQRPHQLLDSAIARFEGLLQPCECCVGIA